MEAPGMRVAIAAKTAQIARSTEANTPHRTGAARRSIGSSASLAGGTPVGRVFSTHPFWHLIEFGSINNPAYRPMTRAARASGLRFEDGRG